MELQGVYIRLFGVPTLTASDGQAVVFTAERPFQMLAYLACRGDWLSRDELAEWLFPERAPGIARSNLRKVLLRVRRLAGIPPLQIVGDRVRWAPDSDLQRFDAACQTRRHADAVETYAPMLLQSMDAGLEGAALDWLDFERGRVAQRWRAAAVERLRELADDPARVAELAQRMLQQDPFDEHAVTALARARETLEDSEAAQPIPSAHRQRVGAAWSVDPASVALIGRRAEISSVIGWLQQGTRVVTISGPGGVGKSRLARRILADMEASHGARRWWVELADIADAAHLPACLATAMSLEARVASPLMAEVERHIGDDPALLCLDNSEHLPDVSALLEALLDACPRLQILNTSRTRLNLAAEQLLVLDGLPLPDEDEEDVDILRRNDAIGVFETRALRADPSFDLARQARDAVRLVHAVEGLPLAIELAAAWVRLLPVGDIVDELSRSLDMLEETGGIDAARDRSLRSSFEHSWKLLREAERASLVALAHLPGEFDRDIASQVARAPLPVVASLVDKSLLRADRQGWFSLHPLLRLCALEKAGALGFDAAAAAARHLSYMAHWLGRFGHPLQAPPRALSAEVERRLPHVRSAWLEAVRLRRADVVRQCAPILLQFFELRGLWPDGLALFAAATDAFAGDATCARAEGLTWRAAASLQVRSGLMAEAEASARRALKLARRSGDDANTMACVSTLGLSLFARGQYERADSLFQYGMKLARAIGDAPRVRVLLGNLAIVRQAMGRYDDALALYRDVLAQSRAADEIAGQVICLNNMGDAYRGLGDWAAARRSYEESLALCDRHGVTTRLATKSVNLGVTFHALGELALADRWLTKARSQLRDNADRLIECSTLLAQSTLCIDRGDADAGNSLLREAATLASALGSDDMRARCAITHGEWLLARGEDMPARRWIARGLAEPALYSVERSMMRQRLARRDVDPAAFGGPSAGSKAPTGDRLPAWWAELEAALGIPSR